MQNKLKEQISSIEEVDCFPGEDVAGPGSIGISTGE
jgi:hypothetical protein